jgi:hypothetical protein
MGEILATSLLGKNADLVIRQDFAGRPAAFLSA